MTKGKLLIIGGKEEKYHGVILKQFIELANEQTGKIGILTTATNYPVEVGKEYQKVFAKLGRSDSLTIDVDTKEKAEDNAILKLVENLSALFITGGDQSRLNKIITGTKLHKMFFEKWEKGMVLSGTSAGASIMGKHMIVAAMTKDEDEILKVEMDGGFGFLETLLIDQHFSQRARFDRLLGAIAEHPELIGIGIDENTAILVDGDEFSVIGEHQVLIIDGKECKFSSVSKSEAGGEELAVSDFKLHTLTAGYKFNLSTRKPIGKEVAK